MPAVNPDSIRQEIRAAERLRKILLAREGALDYLQLNMPHPEDPEDATRSEYEVLAFHRLLDGALADLGKGLGLWFLIIAPPRHGKTQFCKGKISHIQARFPHLDQIFATYNQPFADENGIEVRNLLTSDATRQAFPDFAFKDNRKNPAPDHMITRSLRSSLLGNLYFVGRGGSITGRGGHILWGDDLFKDDEEAESETIRNVAWNWLVRTFLSRRHTEGADVVLQGTRWNRDDIIGRLTDPENKHFNPAIFKKLRVIHLSAVAGMYGAPDDDPVSRAPGEVLWPSHFSRMFFEEARAIDPTGFAKLYQGVPTASDGIYFTSEMCVTYKASERPPLSEMTIYAASDHAVTIKQSSDFTVLLIVGVDRAGVIWVLDVVWARMTPDKTVDEMLRLMRQWKPVIWWAEDDHIGKSIGPFLFKRMREEQIYINVHPSPIKNRDLVQRSQSLQGRMRQGMFKLPADAPWRERAVNQFLMFNGSSANKDDFVSAASHIGEGLTVLTGGAAAAKTRTPPAPSGTYRWIKQQERVREGRDTLRNAMGSM